MNVPRPVNWQEECVLLFPNDPFPRTAEEIRTQLLRAASKFEPLEFREQNIAQIKALSDAELASNLSVEGRLLEIRWALTGERCPHCKEHLSEPPKGGSDAQGRAY